MLPLSCTSGMKIESKATKEAKSEIPCLVNEIAKSNREVGRNPAHNGEVLTGALVQGERDERR